MRRSPPCLPQWWLRTARNLPSHISQCSDLSFVRPGEATIPRRSHSPGDHIRAIQSSSFPQTSPSFHSPAKLSLGREAYLLFQTLNTELQARKHRRSPDSGRTSQGSLPSPPRIGSSPDPLILWALGGLLVGSLQCGESCPYLGSPLRCNGASDSHSSRSRARKRPQENLQPL